MVGVPGKYGRRPIKLLAEHDAHHLVRPGLGAEGEHQLRRIAQRRVVPVRPADGDHQPAPATVAQRGDPVGEVFEKKYFCRARRAGSAPHRRQDAGSACRLPRAFARQRSARGFRGFRQGRKIPGRWPVRSSKNARNSGRQALSRGRPSCGPRQKPRSSSPSLSQGRETRPGPSGSSLPRDPEPATSSRCCRTRGFRGGRHGR